MDIRIKRELHQPKKRYPMSKSQKKKTLCT